jgi:fatty-acyl-CoA synthase
MFHVNAWGLPFASVLVGAKIMMPGPHLDPASLLEDFEQEGVTFTAGVPTVFLAVLQALDAEPDRYDLSKLRSMVIGGSAVPKGVIKAYEERHGIDVVHAWGMTEMSPIGSVAHLTTEMRSCQKRSNWSTGPSRDTRCLSWRYGRAATRGSSLGRRVSGRARGARSRG